MKAGIRNAAAVAGSVILVIGGCVALVSMSPSMQIASAIFVAGFMIAAAILFRGPSVVKVAVDAASLAKAEGRTNG